MKAMNTQKWVIAASVIGIAVFLFAAYQFTSKPVQTVFPQLNTLKPTDNITWSVDKKNILVEYSDLQCPACKVYHEYLKEIAKDQEITKKITLVYRHFPLDTIHPHARAAAYAAEAAGQQGAFFKMQDVLFSKQDEWSKSSDPTAFFKQYANALKLDMTKYEKAFASKELSQKVQDQFISGTEVAVDATPTFFLNGVKITPPQTAEEFKQLLKRQITK